jgi:hypothetical protein
MNHVTSDILTAMRGQHRSSQAYPEPLMRQRLGARVWLVRMTAFTEAAVRRPL